MTTSDADAKFPNFRHLRAISYISQLRSVNGAASFLGISQPAVTLALHQMEKLCGSELFLRRSSGTFPTDMGKIFCRRIDRSLAALSRGIVGNCFPERRSDLSLYHFTTAQIRTVATLHDVMDWDRAAETLGVSVESTKRTVRSVATLLEVPIIDISASTLRLSEPGLHFARAAKLAIREIELGIEELAHQRGESAGTLRIGAMPLARAQILPDALTRVLTEYPQLDIRVQEGAYDYLLNLLRTGDLDIIMGALRGPLNAPDVTETELLRFPLSVVARNDHPLKDGRNLSLAETSDFSWIVNPKGTPSRTLFENAFRLRGIQVPQQLIEVSTLGVIRGMLLQTDHLTMLAQHQIQFEEEVGKLRTLDIDLPETERTIGTHVRLDWEPTQPQSRFVKDLHAVCAADPSSVHSAPSNAKFHIVDLARKGTNDC